jgi:tetratricopeptide (TPR) repeat protein
LFLAIFLTPSISAAKQIVIGTMVGCIRVAPEKELVDVFVVNSVALPMDANFKSTIKEAWKHRKIDVSELKDTTDFFIQVKYTLGNGPDAKPFDFYVDSDNAPKNISNEIIVVISVPGFENLKTDEQVVATVNEWYKQKKYKKCVKNLDELIRRNPFNEDIIYMRANAYLKLDKKEEALSDYEYLRYFLKSSKYIKLESHF